MWSIYLFKEEKNKLWAIIKALWRQRLQIGSGYKMLRLICAKVVREERYISNKMQVLLIIRTWCFQFTVCVLPSAAGFSWFKQNVAVQQQLQLNANWHHYIRHFVWSGSRQMPTSIFYLLHTFPCLSIICTYSFITAVLWLLTCEIVDCFLYY